MARRAGLLLPLFSATSTSSWGIGEFDDLPHLGDWLGTAGFDRLMLLPLGTMPPGESSPYSALSSMAIDPIYIAMEQVDDFAHAGGTAALDESSRDRLMALRAGTRVDYAAVRAVKNAALDVAYARFVADEWSQLTTRAGTFAGYTSRERWWLDDYALFEAIAAREGSLDWREWPAPLRDRDVRALDDARRQLSSEVRRHQYRQWIADTQWQRARAALADRNIRVVGDLPFAPGAQSPEVWSRQAEFRLDVSTGVPPDAFSATGQDWRLPMYDWDVIRSGGYEWLRLRSRRMAALFDAMRVDHLVGFFRTYGRRPDGEAFFNPADEGAQIAQGEEVLRALRESGIEIIAEDLGSIPAFVRESLARLAIPGFKVIRWERAWDRDGHPYIDPRSYPETSVALTGTHDTETLAVWWETTSAEERAAVCALPPLADAGITPDTPWDDAVRDAWLQLAYGAASNDLVVPMQDVFGWRDRINQPATVGAANWTWRLPWPIDRWTRQPEAIARAGFCAAQARASGRH